MNKKTIIIAEAGVNHNGSVELAKQLIDAAAAAGADYVKFQTFNAKKIASKSAKMADYQKKNSDSDNNFQLEMLSRLELTPENHYELIKYSKSKNISFFFYSI